MLFAEHAGVIVCVLVNELKDKQLTHIAAGTKQMLNFLKSQDFGKILLDAWVGNLNNKVKAVNDLPAIVLDATHPKIDRRRTELLILHVPPMWLFWPWEKMME